MDINCDNMCPSIFIKLLNSLSNLQYLRIYDSTLFNRERLCRQDKTMLKKFLNNNKINKITLTTPGDLIEALNILHIFPRIQYFAIQNISTMNTLIFTYDLFREITQRGIYHSLTICFFGIGLEESLLNELQKSIYSRGENCQAYRQKERIYLQWK